MRSDRVSVTPYKTFLGIRDPQGPQGPKGAEVRRKPHASSCMNKGARIHAQPEWRCLL